MLFWVFSTAGSANESISSKFSFLTSLDLSLTEILFITSKEITHNKKHFQFNIVLPQICIIFFTIVSWIISTKLVIDNRMILGTYLINMVWSIYNFIGAITSLIVAYQKPIFRASERIVISEDIKIILNSDSCVTKGTLIDISEKGLGIKLYYDKIQTKRRRL